MMRRCLTLLLLFLAVPLYAQDMRLSAEQQRMLDQLPPAQRQQALSAIRQIQSKSSEERSTQTLNEQTAIASEEGPDEILPLVDAAPRAEPRSRLVIRFTPRGNLLPSEVQLLDADPALNRLIGSHLFVLDDSGVLSLQGIESIPLLGLDQEDIIYRLGATPYLAYFNIDANILGQEPVGVEALKPYGYDVFGDNAGGLIAPSSGPVPPDYVLGPGDTLRVQLFGNLNDIYDFEVTRDGILNLPEIGPVNVAGIPFSEFRNDLEERVQEMLIGTQVSVSMGPLKTIRVYVVGDVNRPGSYVVGGLSTISSALYEAGGISEIGSLRNIQLKRSGNVVARFDVYSLLIRGDTSGDARLQQGDVIFVPPIGNTVSVAGAVKRPAIYEYRGAADVADAVMLAGGIANDAFKEGARLERINEDGSRAVVAVDLSADVSAGVKLRSGDTLIVPEVLPDFDAAVVLSGHVFRPGTYPWYAGMRLAELIRSNDELKPGVDMNYVLIRRERERGGTIEALSVDLAAALVNRESSDNIQLMARDHVMVFSRDLGRQRVIAPILSELESQATYDAPRMQAEISGQVRAPGVYPLEAGMRVSDLIRAGGGLRDDAFALQAELTRYVIGLDNARDVETNKIAMAAVLRGDAGADLPIQPYDFLSITRIPKWESAWTVRLEGEVQFPGEYRVHRGETLAELLQRAGGFTTDAFPEGAVFLRETLKEREEEQIETLARRLEADLTTLSLQNIESSGSETMTTGRALLDQLRNTQPVGRLVIGLDHMEGRGDPIVLRDGDQLLVPTKTQVVSVIGEIQQNTSLLYQAGMSRDDYIELSGGLTRRADKKRIYVVRANGAVLTQAGSRWLGNRGQVEVRPGDTIVVPLDADKMRPLTFWTNVSQIIYQGAIAVAAVQSFN